MFLPQDDVDPQITGLLQKAGARSINDLFRLIERTGISEALKPDLKACEVVHLQCEEPWAVLSASDVAAWLGMPENIDKLCWALDLATLQAGMQCCHYPPRFEGPATIW